MDRAERRRQRRQAAKQGTRAGDVLLEHTWSYERVKPTGQLSPKKHGEHRWVVICTYGVSEASMRTAGDPGAVNLLDHENLVAAQAGCYDCEQALGTIKPGSWCPAGSGLVIP
jgi:hypothetical protein